MPNEQTPKSEIKQINIKKSPEALIGHIPIASQIDVSIGRDCPVSCGFYAPVQAPSTENVEDIEYLSSFRRWLPRLVKKSGCKSLIFTGGEPTLPRYINRLIESIKICNQTKEGWEVLAVITSGAFLHNKLPSGETYAQALAEAGLKQFTWSVAHFESDKNRKNYGNIMPDLDLIADTINQTSLPFRINTILQKGFIENPDDLLGFINWAFDPKINAESIYVRELFEYVDRAERKPQGEDPLRSGRDPKQYREENHIESQTFIEFFREHQDFEFVNSEKEDFREKSTVTFKHRPTGKKVLITKLKIGNETPTENESPYIVFREDGKPYTSWQGDGGDTPNLDKYGISESVLN